MSAATPRAAMALYGPAPDEQFDALVSGVKRLQELVESIRIDALGADDRAEAFALQCDGVRVAALRLSAAIRGAQR